MPVWINLRQHAIDLTYGDRRTVSQGKWIVLRIYRIGEYSQYWDPDRKEAYGGPKYNYDDFTIRSISRLGKLGMTGSAGSTQPMDPVVDIAGLEDVTDMIFAITHDERFTRLPQIGDEIFEIEEYEGLDEPVPPLHATARYKIVNSAKDTGDLGRDEAIYLFARLFGGES